MIWFINLARTNSCQKTRTPTLSQRTNTNERTRGTGGTRQDSDLSRKARVNGTLDTVASSQLRSGKRKKRGQKSNTHERRNFDPIDKAVQVRWRSVGYVRVMVQ